MPKIKNVPKVVATIVMTIGLTSGLVFAGSVVYNKIWKEPEKVVGFYDKDYTSKEITTQEKDDAISEDEARKKASELLTKFGYEDEKIVSMKLQNNADNYELEWVIKTENKISISIDGKNPKSYNLFTNDINNLKEIESYRANREEIETVAKDFCKKYGYDVSEYSNIKITNNLNDDKEAYLWYIDFSKEYDGIINPYQRISIGLIPEINKIYYFIVKDFEFENNPVKITEEQAKQTVLDAEKNIDTGYKVKDTKVELDIAQMNGYAYIRLHDYERYCKQQNTPDYPLEEYLYYRTESLVRKVWAVIVEYDIPSDDLKGMLHKLYGYSVDATTGEIIGTNFYTKYRMIERLNNTPPTN